MELMYRGVRYQAAPALVKIEDTPQVGQYRGSTIHFHKPAPMPALHRILHLVYRGVGFEEDLTVPMS